jgi:cytochrome P450
VAHGVPVTAAINRFRFDHAAADLLTEYRINRRVSIDEAERRIRKHLMPYFTGRRMSEIAPADIRAYVAQRQTATEVSRTAYTVTRKDGTILTVPAQTRTIAGVSNAEINRELALLKRMFRLAVQAEKLIRQPHVPLLEERNARAGFFEPEQLDAVIRHYQRRFGR